MLKNTPSFGGYGNKHCEFCGEKQKHDFEVESGQIYTYWFCDCEPTLLWLDIEKKKQELENMTKDKTRVANRTKVRFEIELLELKRKYKIEEE